MSEQKWRRVDVDQLASTWHFSANIIFPFFVIYIWCQVLFSAICTLLEFLVHNHDWTIYGGFGWYRAHVARVNATEDGGSALRLTYLKV